jgi:heat shock protein HslJ
MTAAVVMAVVVALSACKPPPGEPTRPSSTVRPPTPGPDGTWVLTHLAADVRGGLTLIGREFELRFDQGTLVFEPCDPWTVDYTTSGETIAFGPVRVPGPRDHARGCPGDASNLEERLAALLPLATWWDASNRTLKLTEGRTGRLLVVARHPDDAVDHSPPPPPGSAPLLEYWRVTSFVDSRTKQLVMPVSRRLTMTFLSTALVGGDGCLSFGGMWQTEGQRFVRLGASVRQIDTSGACPDESFELTESFSATLSQVKWWDRTDRTLRLSVAEGGQVLVTAELIGDPGPPR